MDSRAGTPDRNDEAAAFGRLFTHPARFRVTVTMGYQRQDGDRRCVIRVIANGGERFAKSKLFAGTTTEAVVDALTFLDAQPS